VCPHEATAKGHSMRFLALPITPTVFTGIGFSNPDQAWAQALKELPAAEPLLTTPDERSMPARVPVRIPTSTHEQVREPTPSPVPSSGPSSMESPTRDMITG
jgi:hypothetical protein